MRTIHKYVPIILQAVLLIVLTMVTNTIETSDTDTKKETASSNIQEQNLIISPNAYFFDSDIQITLTTSNPMDDAVIYYTTDGSTPTCDSYIYSEPINLICTDELKSITIKASLYHNNTFSEPVTHSYFVGTTVFERFSVPIVALTIDSHELYDPINGIMVEGQEYTDLHEQNANILPNFLKRGDEWVRKAHMEIIAPDGSNLVSQNIGLSIAGRGSAYYEVKSFDIKADYDYDIKNSFYNIVNYDLMNPRNQYMVGDETDQIRLRNSGGDLFDTFIRQNIANELALQSGLHPVSANSPVVTFINGKYYSLLQAQNKFTRSNLANALSLDKDKIEMYKGEEETCAKHAGLYELGHSDFNNPEVRDAFESMVDVDDMFKYYAIQMILCNDDWPDNNYCIFRSTEVIPNNPYGDGKWHFVLFDTDNMFRLNDEFTEVFQLLCTDEACTSIFTNMLQCDIYKEKFINTVCDLMATSFSPDNLAEIINYYSEQIQDEIPYFFESGKERLVKTAQSWESSVSDMAFYADERMKYLIGIYLWEFFKASEPYTLEITPSHNGTITCNTVEIKNDDKKLKGTYYTNYPVKVSATANPGYKLSHYIINGNELYQESFLTTSDFLYDGQITVEAVFTECDNAIPFICDWSAIDNHDYIEITNCYQVPLSLNGYFLSDNTNNILKYPLPDITLEPGEIIRISCKSNVESTNYVANFNLKPMETLILSYADGTAVQSEFIYRNR